MNFLSSPLETTVFFVDRSLGGKIVPHALTAAGWRVERHDDHFPQATTDAGWITEVGRKGWIILTADQRIRYNPLEKAALLASGTHAFLLGGRKDLTGREMAQAFLAAQSGILRAIAQHKPPALFKVYQQGQVGLWLRD